MGADIHLRAEYDAGLPVTLDAETIEAWLRDDPVATRQSHNWQHAERLIPNPYFANEGGLKMEVGYDDRFYTGRDYWLFGLLSGVRGEGPARFDEAFPDDASEHVTAEYESWGLDAHTPCFATLAQLDEHEWVDPDYRADRSFPEAIERLRELASEHCGGDPHRVRFVWWFDN